MDVQPIRRGVLGGASAAALLWAASAQAGLVINEFDYDQVGSDTGEFVELFNASADTIDLAGFRLSLVNGSDGVAYREYELGAGALVPGGFFVLCGRASVVPNCDLDVSPDTNLMQNGAPDAIALYRDGLLVDSVSYEGLLPGFTEGDPVDVMDDNTTPFLTLARAIDGFDSDNNLADFILGCATPGYSNQAFGGACTTPVAVAPVPEPSAALLMGVGLAGVLELQRRRRRR